MISTAPVDIAQAIAPVEPVQHLDLVEALMSTAHAEMRRMIGQQVKPLDRDAYEDCSLAFEQLRSDFAQTRRQLKDITLESSAGVPGLAQLAKASCMGQSNRSS